MQNTTTVLALLALLIASGRAENLNWVQAENFRYADIQAIPGKGSGLSLQKPDVTGIKFTNHLSIRQLMPNHNFMNGSGVALGDYDGDGWCDIYLCQLEGSNALYKNEGGWRFVNVTDGAGVACTGQASTGAVFADINGDGRPDLIVTALGGPNSLFINQGNGRFVDSAAGAGIASRLGGMSMALGDVDGNGTQDLYIANYGATSILRSGGALNVAYVNGRPVVRGRYAQRIQIIGDTMFELGEPDALYLNDGNGNFRAVSWTDGTFLDEDGKALHAAPWDQGLAVMFRDVNGDRAPDIYVCNDAFTPDRFWINDGTGKFRAMSRLKWRSTSHSSMGVDFADYDRDGDDDFVVVDMLSRERRYLVTQRGTIPPQPKAPGDLLTQIQMRRNTFYENRGDGTYAEVANLLGIAASEWSWNPVFIDLDLDGWEDLLISNGFPFNMDDMDTKDRVRALGRLTVEQSRRTLLMYPKLDTPNMAFRNIRGTRFEVESDAWGFNSTEVSNGMAIADLDNDGDCDVVVNTFNGPALVYRNESTAPRVLVRLKGKAPNTQGIGAKIVLRGGPTEQAQEVISGGRYASGDDPVRVFAAGEAKHLTIEVTWRNGAKSRLEGALPNRIYEIDERGAVQSKSVQPAPVDSLFADVSVALKHLHHEVEFNDFELQPGLAQKLSRPGPGITWFDVDGNGWEDLLIGSGRGGKLELYLNADGRFQKSETGVAARDDLTAVAARRNSRDAVELIIGASNFETGRSNQISLYEVLGTNFTLTGTLPVKAAIGALALTEGGGNLLLFAGGKFLPGKYPKAVPSHLFKYQEGNWVESSVEGQKPGIVGSVSGAAWADLDDDESPELLIACDWGPLKIYQFKEGSLRDRSKEWGVAEWIGRWQSIATGDFDGDGKIDFVAGNWGTNSLYNQAADGQVDLYFGEFTHDQRVEMIEAYVTSSGKVAPWRDMVAFRDSLPWLPTSFSTHLAYSEASVSEILGAKMAKASVIRTKTLATTVFLNRGGRFEAKALPREAQYAPAFGIAVADFNLDGFQDLVLAQNFFGTRETDGPLDAGRGLLVRGNSRGEFETVAGATSGIVAYGEQRGCAVADFNHDGRADIVLGQNGSETKLFANRMKERGIRVRLIGSGQNPSAFGAVMRLDGKTAICQSAGAGYLSQDGSVKVIPASTRTVEVTWPNGGKNSFTIPAGSESVELRIDGVILRSN